MHTSDQEYVERCRNGSPDDFRFLVRRYEGPVFAFVATRLNDHALAREAVQESLVRAFFALGKLRKPEAFHAWLLGIAGRVALEYQRARFRRQEVPESQTATEPASPTVENDLALDEAIAALPEPQRRMILLRYFEKLSCQEIADQLHLPLGSVTKTLSRAYAELRALLAERESLESPNRLEKSP